MKFHHNICCICCCSVVVAVVVAVVVGSWCVSCVVTRRLTAAGHSVLTNAGRYIMTDTVSLTDVSLLFYGKLVM